VLCCVTFPLNWNEFSFRTRLNSFLKYLGGKGDFPDGILRMLRIPC